MGDLYSVVIAHCAETLKRARRVVIFVVGVTVVLIGLALLVLPGPAFVVIPTGLAILASEFVWARRLLRKARSKSLQIGHSVFSRAHRRTTAGDAEHDGGT